MGRLWYTIISQTSQSPLKLVAFGGVCVLASWGLGQVFTGLMGPGTPVNPKEQKARQEHFSYDDKRFATAREQRLSSMVRDMLEGNGEQHWNAAMRGTVVQHPVQESKTQNLDQEALARAAESAKPKRGWWG